MYLVHSLLSISRKFNSDFQKILLFPKINSPCINLILLCECNLSEIIELKKMLRQAGSKKPRRNKYIVNYFSFKLDVEYLEKAIFKISFRDECSIELDLSELHNLEYFLILLFDIPIPEIYISNIYRKVVGKAKPSVIDVGANVGFISFLYILLSFDLKISFEAMPHIFNLKVNNKNFDFYNIGISDTNGIKTFYKSLQHNQGHTCESSIVERFPRLFGAEPSEVKVKTRPLSEYLKSSVDILKLDVEGHELEVMKSIHKDIIDKKIGCIIFEAYDERLGEIFNAFGDYYDFKYTLCSIGIGEHKMISINSEAEVRFLKLLSPPCYIFSLKNLLSK